MNPSDYRLTPATGLGLGAGGGWLEMLDWRSYGGDEWESGSDHRGYFRDWMGGGGEIGWHGCAAGVDCARPGTRGSDPCEVAPGRSRGGAFRALRGSFDR